MNEEDHFDANCDEKSSNWPIYACHLSSNVLLWQTPRVIIRWYLLTWHYFLWVKWINKKKTSFICSSSRPKNQQNRGKIHSFYTCYLLIHITNHIFAHYLLEKNDICHICTDDNILCVCNYLFIIVALGHSFTWGLSRLPEVLCFVFENEEEKKTGNYSCTIFCDF